MKKLPKQRYSGFTDWLVEKGINLTHDDGTEVVEMALFWFSENMNSRYHNNENN